MMQDGNRSLFFTNRVMKPTRTSPFLSIAFVISKPKKGVSFLLDIEGEFAKGRKFCSYKTGSESGWEMKKNWSLLSLANTT